MKEEEFDNKEFKFSSETLKFHRKFDLKSEIDRKQHSKFQELNMAEEKFLFVSLFEKMNQ